jgi:hypothetical protein
MAVNCDPSTLPNVATCFFECVPDGMHKAIQTYLIAQIANSLVGTSTDPQVLMTAAAKFQLLRGMEDQVMIYLLCQIVNK